MLTTSKLVEKLKTNFFFKKAPEEAAGIAGLRSQVKEIAEGEIIYQTGEPATHVYLILYGLVKIKIKTRQGAKIINKAAGDFFGEREVLEGLERSSTAIAEIGSELLLIPASRFFGLVYNNGEIKTNVKINLARTYDLSKEGAEVILHDAEPGSAGQLISQQVEMAAVEEEEFEEQEELEVQHDVPAPPRPVTPRQSHELPDDEPDEELEPEEEIESEEDLEPEEDTELEEDLELEEDIELEEDLESVEDFEPSEPETGDELPDADIEPEELDLRDELSEEETEPDELDIWSDTPVEESVESAGDIEEEDFSYTIPDEEDYSLDTEEPQSAAGGTDTEDSILPQADQTPIRRRRTKPQSAAGGPNPKPQSAAGGPNPEQPGLLKLIVSICGAERPGDIYDALKNDLPQMVGAREFVMFVFDGGFLTAVGGRKESETNFAVREKIAYELITMKEPVTLFDLDGSGMIEGLENIDQRDIPSSLLYYPLTGPAQRVTGCFIFFSSVNGRFSSSDVMVLSDLMKAASGILEKVTAGKTSLTAKYEDLQKYTAFFGSEIKMAVETILSVSETLDRGKLSEKVRFGFDIIRERASGLKGFLDSIQFFVGKISGFTKQPYLVSELLDDFLVKISEPAKQREVTLLRKYQADMVMFFNRELFIHALSLITQNSFDAMPEGGKVYFSTSANESNILISIRDTGPGIHFDIRDKIFEPFFTFGKTGVGLGLPIANKIIKEHGGYIYLESSRNQGTEIIIALPV